MHLATSSSFLFQFNENIMAHSGSITMASCSQCTSPSVVIDVTSASVTTQGAYAVVTPPADLNAGEVYGVTISAGAFKDALGNTYGGLKAGVLTVSTKPLLNFALTKTDTFKVSDLTYWDGSRNGAAVTVDADNVIYVAGGMNDTGAEQTSASMSFLNDVYSLATLRPRHCASAKQPTFDCTTDGEKNGPAVTKCDAGGKFAGKSNYQIKVWRAPSPSGTPCATADGLDAGTVGQILSVPGAHTKCPCPTCKAAPPNISATVPAGNAIPDLTYKSSCRSRQHLAHCLWFARTKRTTTTCPPRASCVNSRRSSQVSTRPRTRSACLPAAQWLS